jgi:hypothetical protein
VDRAELDSALDRIAKALDSGRTEAAEAVI